MSGSIRKSLVVVPLEELADVPHGGLLTSGRSSLPTRFTVRRPRIVMACSPDHLITIDFRVRVEAASLWNFSVF